MPQMQRNALEISLNFQFGPIPAIFSAHAPVKQSKSMLSASQLASHLLFKMSILFPRDAHQLSSTATLRNVLGLPLLCLRLVVPVPQLRQKLVQSRPFPSFPRELSHTSPKSVAFNDVQILNKSFIAFFQWKPFQSFFITFFKFTKDHPLIITNNAEKWRSKLVKKVVIRKCIWCKIAVAACHRSGLWRVHF